MDEMREWENESEEPWAEDRWDLVSSIVGRS